MSMTGSLNMGRCPDAKNGKPNIARAVELMTEWFKKRTAAAPERDKHLSVA